VSLFAPAPPKITPHAHHVLIPHWLIHLGTLGIFSVAVIDSSIIPLPIPGSTDLLLLWLISHNHDPWLILSAAILGSVIGGCTTWHVGRKGGEKALHRWVSPRILHRIVGWVEVHPILSVFLPTVLPPPIPLSPFILASGALGMPFKRFIAIYAAARILRYSLVAWLAVHYGRRIVSMWSKDLNKWSTPLLVAFLTLTVAGMAIGIWQFRKNRHSSDGEGSAIEPDLA
jgi:membrane protein YqaA with SNARE-associated domain